MKDALGHGSDGQGLGEHGRYLVQKLNTRLAGNSWQTVKRYRNQTVAERVAQNMRVDAPTLVRTGTRR